MHRRPGKRDQHGRGTAPAARLRLFALLPIFFSFCVLVGCSTPKGLPGGDPLLTGGAPLPRNPGKFGPGPAQGTAGTGKADGQPQASNVPPLPGIPTSGTGFSPAALASGRRDPFDRSRDLQINDWPRGPQGGGWTAPGNTPRSNGSGVTLRPPEPAGDTGSLPGPTAPPAPPSQPAPSPVPPSPPTGAATYEQVVAQLQARGAYGQKQELIPSGQWQFSCSVRHPQNPNQQRTYRASGRDLREAMQAVLQQIDRDARQ